MRPRERERESMCQRRLTCVCVCDLERAREQQRETESVCVCVMRVREREIVCARESACEKSQFSIQILDAMIRGEKEKQRRGGEEMRRRGKKTCWWAPRVLSFSLSPDHRRTPAASVERLPDVCVRY